MKSHNRKVINEGKAFSDIVGEYVGEGHNYYVIKDMLNLGTLTGGDELYAVRARLNDHRRGRHWDYVLGFAVLKEDRPIRLEWLKEVIKDSWES